MFSMTMTGYGKGEYNLQEITALFECGVTSFVSVKKSEGAFPGQSVVLTGTQQNYKRSQTQKLIEKRGD